MPKSQIIKDVVEDAVPIEKSLRRLYVLAVDIHNAQLAEWALHELKGYSKDDILPEYRRTRSSHFIYSGINGSCQITNAHLPLEWIPEEVLNQVINIENRDGIDLVVRFTEGKRGGIADRSDLAGFVSEATEGEVACISIVQRIPQSFYSRICAEVKSKMLQVLLEMEKKYGNLDELGIDISNQKTVQLAADNSTLNRMVLNLTVPEQEVPKEKLPSKIAWNVIIPIITGVVGAIIGAVVIAFLGL